MDKSGLLDLLHAHFPTLQGKFFVNTLGIFGSHSRGEATSTSDLDVLVTSKRPVGMVMFMRLKYYLEELTGFPVDLVTPNAIKERMKEQIFHEVVYI